MRIKEISAEFVEACKKEFGHDLVSIVLFGSYARGTSREGSDIDFLVIANKLPKKLSARMDLIDDFVMYAIKKHHKRVMPVFYEPAEFFDENNMLLFGILTGYIVLYGKPAWTKSLEKIKPAIREMKPEYIEGGKTWSVEALI